MKVVENLKAICAAKSITQRELAAAMDCSQSAVSLIFKGKRHLRVDELENIAAALNMEVIDIYTWPAKYVSDNNKKNRVRTIIQVECDETQNASILRQLFGEEGLRIINGEAQ